MRTRGSHWHGTASTPERAPRRRRAGRSARAAAGRNRSSCRRSRPTRTARAAARVSPTPRRPVHLRRCRVGRRGPDRRCRRRARLFFRDQARLLLPSTDPVEPPSGRIHDAVRGHLGQRGASFWSELRGATNDATDAELLEALWDLVWAGEVTNDSLAPLRSLLAGKPKRTAPKTSRPRPGRLTRIGPPAGAGRWSLVAPLALPASSSRTESAARRVPSSCSSATESDTRGAPCRRSRGRVCVVHPALKALGGTRPGATGPFVAGLGAIQVGRVRSRRSARAPRTTRGERRGPRAPTRRRCMARRPLPWPQSGGRPARAAGSMVILVEGEAVAHSTAVGAAS
jgi:ATP-dependent Lhr-like helicase